MVTRKCNSNMFKIFFRGRLICTNFWNDHLKSRDNFYYGNLIYDLDSSTCFVFIFCPLDFVILIYRNSFNSTLYKSHLCIVNFWQLLSGLSRWEKSIFIFIGFIIITLPTGGGQLLIIIVFLPSPDLLSFLKSTFIYVHLFLLFH